MDMRHMLLLLMVLGLARGVPAAELVGVDLSSDLGPATQRASGFLHAMSATVPGPDYVDPLKPKLFRMAAEDWQKEGAGAWANYDRVRKLGARLQIVVSDSHGYALANWWPGDDGDWSKWQFLVDSMVKRALSEKRIVEWDIWNEPNIGYFWQRDRDRFFETWKRGCLKVRELDPSAVVVGPSLSGYDRKYLEEFLTFCKTNNVVPDILSWHEFGSPRSIPKHVDEMRAFMKSSGIPVKPICLNEIISGAQSTKPGATVAYFAAIERAKVEGACHACWNDKDPGVSACSNKTLDGILTYPDRKPRSVWWTYKAYADVTGTLAKLEPGKTVDGVAGVNSKARLVRMVLGRNTKDGETCDAELTITGLKAAPWLARQGKVRVVAERIPDSGFEELTAPTKVIDAVQEVKAGSLKVIVPAFGPSDAYSVMLAPGSD